MMDLLRPQKLRIGLKAYEANMLDDAVQKVLDNGSRTKDITSKGTKEVSTSQMGDAIVSNLK